MKENGLEDIDNLYTTTLNDFYYNNGHTTKNTVKEWVQTQMILKTQFGMMLPRF